MASTNIQTFSGDVTVTSNLTVDTGTFHVDSVSGRIGIGKTDPAFALDVSGTINATSLYAGGSQLQTDPWTSDASDIYYTTGAVGIGTNSPTKTLEVQGTLRLSNASTGESSELHVMNNMWGVEAALTQLDPVANDLFGDRIAISGDGNTAIVGAYGENTSAGSAYIFTYSGGSWSQQTKFNNPAPAAYDNFGWSVAISGDGTRAIVGVPFDDISYTDQGSAYIYTYSGGSWSSGTRIVASDAGQSDYYGYSVAISGDGNTALVGAYRADPGGVTDQGAAYIFTWNGSVWDSGTKIVASDPIPGSTVSFGSAVAISGDGNTALVGAYTKVTLPTYSSNGGAYIFTRSGGSWDSGTTLVAPNLTPGSFLGYSADISNDGMYAIVGAISYQAAPNFYTGAAYIFAYSGGSWSQGTRIIASDFADRDSFGWSVAISGDGTTALVGEYGGKSAHIFNRSGTTWDVGTKVLNTVNSSSLGRSVALPNDATYALVGSNGTVYMFTPSVTTLASTTSITASGTILSFTGQHMCCPDGPMSQGQIVSANKNKYITLNGPLTTGARAINSSESIPVVCLSNVANDKNVFGVVDHHEQGGTKRLQESGIGNVTQEKELGDNRVIVNSIGEGAMWVANTNGNLVSGNYITSSNIAGYGQKQDDNKLHSYTVAKITMDCDFEPEDLPVQVIKKDAQGKNVLDTYGRIQWEDTDRTEKAYRIRYLTTEGQRTDQANAVWTAAYVGCTYHCG